jgi:hypothetical protein
LLIKHYYAEFGQVLLLAPSRAVTLLCLYLLASMKIAFIGHSYHERTGSSTFFTDLLRKLGRVETFYDESWRAEPAPWARNFDSSSFDCVVIWQMTNAFQYIREPHPNAVFVPMYDAMEEGGEVHWSRKFNSAKVLCFSSALHRAVARHTPRSSYFQYYPDPGQFSVVDFGQTRRGIFWSRVAAIDENVIARLCGDQLFDRFTLHDAADPCAGIGAKIMDKSPIRTRVMDRGGWREHRQDYLAAVAQHNIFFAPRPCEGIGMSALEAMAMGLCVIATDRPTHNEYISHGKNGILYDLTRVAPVNMANAAELGARARESIEEGFKRWSALEDQLMRFISMPTHQFDPLSRPCSA